MRKGQPAFTPAEVLDLRRRAARPQDGGDPTFSIAAEARRFSCSHETLRRLIRGETYGTVRPPEDLPAALALAAAALSTPPEATSALDRFIAEATEARDGPEALKGLAT